MILWTIKLFGIIRRAVAGRKYPHQLAWAVAFGLLLGIVPHGILLALVLAILVLSLKLNHAMAGLTAVAASFAATHLDPVSHEVGNYVLTHPSVAEHATAAWAMPMVPWTQLNNTVVLGSFVIGVAALVPVFVLTYPLFRLWAPVEKLAVNGEGAETNGSVRGKLSEPENEPASVASRRGIATSNQILLVDSGTSSVPASKQVANRPETKPDQARTPAGSGTGKKQDGSPIQFIEIDSPHSVPPPAARRSQQPTTARESQSAVVETKIDVIRLKEPAEPSSDEPSETSSSSQPTSLAGPEPQPMDEALNYLLRQLRDSQQRNDAA